MNQTQTTCPHCGAPLRLIKADGFTASDRPGLLGRVFSRPPQRPYEATAPAAQPWSSAPPAAGDDLGNKAALLQTLGGTTRSVRTYRRRDIASDVMPAAVWSVIGGGLIGLSSIAVAIAQRWAWHVPLGVWLGSTTGLFFVAGWRILNDASVIEHEEDLTLPGQRPVAPAAPARTERALRVQVGTDDDQRRQYADLPDTRAFWDLADAVTSDRKPFAESTASWCGMPIDVPSHETIDEMGFRQLRDLFLRRGWATWKNANHHQQGVQLLAAGRAVLRDVAAATPPPPGG